MRISRDINRTFPFNRARAIVAQVQIRKKLIINRTNDSDLIIDESKKIYTCNVTKDSRTIKINICYVHGILKDWTKKIFACKFKTWQFALKLKKGRNTFEYRKSVPIGSKQNDSMFHTCNVSNFCALWVQKKIICEILK